MTRRKHEQIGIDEHAAQALSELFVDTDHLEYFDFDVVELAPFGHILTAVTAMGGMVTVFSRDDGNGIVISIRVSDKRKSYTFESTEQWDVLIEQLAYPWKVALGKYLEARKVSPNGKVPDST
jgi:hypothetical protein